MKTVYLHGRSFRPDGTADSMRTEDVPCKTAPLALPSIKTLSAVFSEPKKAREILELTRARLLELPAGAERARGCYNPPPTYDIRMHCLNAIDRGLHGVEAIESTDGQYADYLNTGDTYAQTVIYWRGAYRVQSIGGFIETMARQRVNFR